jgi:glycosyltransferase involved in cell wall biosynthesis
MPLNHGFGAPGSVTWKIVVVTRPALSTKASESHDLEVTLVVPVRNEEADIDRLAAHIEAQTLAPAAVVFVDDGSVDRTVERLRPWCTRYPTWRVIEAGDGTPGRGRNVGIEAAATEWVALTDAGIDIDSHWLARLVAAAAAEPDAEAVWGTWDPDPVNLFGAVAELAFVPPPARTERGPHRGPHVASSLLRRDAWARVGGFPDLRASEDVIFVRRLNEAGVRMTNAPEAMARWRPPATALETFRRFRTYSRVNVLAGQQRYWHYGVARMYLAASPFAVMALRRRRWALVPAAGLVLRSALTVARRREGRSPAWALNPARVAGVGAVIALIDAATFTGWIEAARERRG